MPMRFVTFLSLMLDRAKIGFGGHDHFIRKTNNANAVSTIRAMKFRNPIKVLEFLAIKNNEIASC